MKQNINAKTKNVNMKCSLLKMENKKKFILQKRFTQNQDNQRYNNTIFRY